MQALSIILAPALHVFHFENVPQKSTTFNSYSAKAVSRVLAIIKVLLRSKNILTFPSDFETLFTKQSPCEILGLNFEKTLYSNYNFPI